MQILSIFEKPNLRQIFWQEWVFSAASIGILFYFVKIFNYLSFHFIALAIVTCLVFPAYRRGIVLALSLALSVFWGTTFTTIKYGGQIYNTSGDFKIETFVGHGRSEVLWTAVSVLMTFAGLFGLRFLIQEIRKKMGTAFVFLPHVILLALTFSLCFVDLSTLTTKPFFRAFILAIMGLINLSWYFMMYLARPRAVGTREKIIHLLECMPPLWTRTFEPRNIVDLEHYLGDRLQNLKTIRSGFFLIARSYLVLIVLDMVKVQVQILIQGHSQMGDKTYVFWRDFAGDYVVHADKSLYLIHWVFFLFSTSHFLIQSHYGFAGMVVGVARAMGFELPMNTRRPWQARCFSEFCARMMYYYNLVIINYFYVPFLKMSARFKWTHNLRKFVGLVFAVTIGGEIFHLFRDSYFFLGHSILPTLIPYARDTVPFFLAFGIASSISELLRRQTVPIQERWYSSPLFLMRNLIFYSFLYNLRYATSLGAGGLCKFYFHLFW